MAIPKYYNNKKYAATSWKGMINLSMMPNIKNFYLPNRVIIPNRDDWLQKEFEVLGANICWFNDGSKTGDRAEILRLG